MTPPATPPAAAALATWDPAAVVAQAKELIHTSNYEKVADARKAVDETIASWVATVQQLELNDAARGTALVTALYSQYAALEIALRQFKQATKVFESAVSCPVARASVSLWLQYAAFCVERKKFSNARKVFLRALAAVSSSDRDALWPRFHAFVVAHIEPTMTLETLQAQVPVPAAGAGASAPQASSPPSAAPSPAPTAPTPSVAPPAALLAPEAAPAATSASAELTIALDPALAFVDKTGTADAAAPGTSKKRDAAALDADDASKRARGDAPTQFFHAIPTALPVIRDCPHLLFDALSPGTHHVEIPNDLLDRLSDVLRDNAVFQGVKDLSTQQRARDRATLYRWQDLVGMQMKEGSELCARHATVEQQLRAANAPAPEVAAVQTQHAAQRREFVARCQMSQQQFIEITGVDRASALKAQQISLENMKIPAMCVTTDADAIAQQRGILSLILEAEKLWREMMASKSAAAAASPGKKSSPVRRGSSDAAAGPASASSSSSSRGGSAPSHYAKQQDHAASSSYASRSGSGSFRGGRGGGGYGSGHRGAGSTSSGGGSGDHRYGTSSSRSAAPHSHRSSSSGGGAPFRRDYDDAYDDAPSHRYVSRQPLHVRTAASAASGSGGYAAHHRSAGPSYGSDRSDYSPDFGPQPGRGAPPSDVMMPRGRFESGQAPGWRSRSESRYGSDRQPPAAAMGSYAMGGPKPQPYARGRAFGGAGSAPQQQQQPPYGGYGSFAGASQQQQRGPGAYHHQAHASGYDSSDYGAPPSNAPYAHRAPGPYHQQQQPPPSSYNQAPPSSGPFHPQRGGRGGGGYGHQQQQPPPAMMGHQQAQGYARGGGGFRRGGGRFGRR